MKLHYENLKDKPESLVFVMRKDMSFQKEAPSKRHRLPGIWAIGSAYPSA